MEKAIQTTAEAAERRGVGPEGLTLIEGLRKSREVLESSGHYHGVTELRLKAENYLHYESLHARLRSAVVNARETSKKISASPGVREVGESVVALYTPETLAGRLVVAAVNLGTRTVNGFASEVLVLGLPDADGNVVLLTPDRDVPLGGRVY